MRAAVIPDLAHLDLTKTQKRLMSVLCDGMAHSQDVLRTCLPVDDSCSLRMHVMRLRRKVVAVGYNIVHVNGSGYMLMRRLPQGE